MYIPVFTAAQALQRDDVESGHKTPGQEIAAPSVEERLATLEGRIQEQAVFMADVRGSTVEAIRDLRRDIDRQFQLIDRRFEQVDRRFEHVDQRFEQVDQRFERLERLMMWMLGVTLTGFTAVMVAVIGSISGLR